MQTALRIFVKVINRPDNRSPKPSPSSRTMHKEINPPFDKLVVHVERGSFSTLHGVSGESASNWLERTGEGLFSEGGRSKALRHAPLQARGKTLDTNMSEEDAERPNEKMRDEGSERLMMDRDRWSGKRFPSFEGRRTEGDRKGFRALFFLDDIALVVGWVNF